MIYKNFKCLYINMVFEITLISYIPFKKRLLPIVEKVYFFKKIILSSFAVK